MENRLTLEHLASYLPYGLKLVNALNEEITMLGFFVKENKTTPYVKFKRRDFSVQ
jgi:hypothetical protein